MIRITGDCPFVDAELVDSLVREFKTSDVDYCSNVAPATYPDGMDVEVFSFSALEQTFFAATTAFHKEHVTPYIRTSGMFKTKNIPFTKDLSDLRWTLDEINDFVVINKVFEYFSPKIHFSWLDVLSLQGARPDLFIANEKIIRNEGAKMGSGQKLWKRAKVVIPGGNMLLSKRAEMFLPDQWPAYFSKAKGCNVWDMDGNKFIDMSIMGIGTNILGYGLPEVDEAVRKVVEQGNMSTFNCPEEVYLAERLIEIHPWADMVRLARTGGEANAISIRIARAATGKDKVAFCGYHGWHDWYLSANLEDDSTLEGHLLPGLEPKGVPQNLKGTMLPFNYNKIEELEAIVANHDIGVIKMEVSRNVEPEDGFLEGVRKIATDNNILLIFDECTSGFRETFGGLHKKYGVDPDMAVFSKALGNGYAISAVIGIQEVMEAVQSTFISSTFWTERIGPTAGLKTLEIMEREKSWKKITITGQEIGKRWKALAEKYELPIEIGGLPALVNFSIPIKNWLKYKTLITQEMLKKGFLAANSVYVCTEHTSAIIDEYLNELDPLFATIRECEDGRNVDDLLEGPMCHAGFKRLN